MSPVAGKKDNAGVGVVGADRKDNAGTGGRGIRVEISSPSFVDMELNAGMRNGH